MVNESRSMPYRTRGYLKNPEEIAEYLNAAIENRDEQILLMAIFEVMEAMPNISGLVQQNNLSEDLIYQLLPEDGKELNLFHLCFILHALGLEISIRPRQLTADDITIPKNRTG